MAQPALARTRLIATTLPGFLLPAEAPEQIAEVIIAALPNAAAGSHVARRQR
jgi:hypothetical protein